MNIYDCMNKRCVLEKEHVFFYNIHKMCYNIIWKGDIKILNKIIWNGGEKINEQKRYYKSSNNKYNNCSYYIDFNDAYFKSKYQLGKFPFLFYCLNNNIYIGTSYIFYETVIYFWGADGNENTWYKKTKNLFDSAQ